MGTKRISTRKILSGAPKLSAKQESTIVAVVSKGTNAWQRSVQSIVGVTLFSTWFHCLLQSARNEPEMLIERDEGFAITCWSILEEGSSDLPRRLHRREQQQVTLHISLLLDLEKMLGVALIEDLAR